MITIVYFTETNERRKEKKKKRKEKPDNDDAGDTEIQDGNGDEEPVKGMENVYKISILIY